MESVPVTGVGSLGLNVTVTVASVRPGMLSARADGEKAATSLAIDWILRVSLPRLWMSKARLRRRPMNSEPKSRRLRAPW